MIKNERQYELTNGQAKKFQATIDQLRSQLPERPTRLQKAEVEALESQYEDLRAEMNEYLHLKAGQVRSFPVSDLSELPIALIRARIARGLTHKELAERTGIHEQQIQQYEAKDYSGASLARLKLIAEALNVFVPNNVILPAEVSGSYLLKKLKELGFDTLFIKTKLMPRSIGPRIQEISDRGEFLEAAKFASRALDIPLPDFLTHESHRLNISAAAGVRHKLSRSADATKVTLFTVYAHRIALLALQAYSKVSHKRPSEDTNVVHDEIIKLYGKIDFESSLRYCWEELGIPVVPLKLHGGFHGATWRINGSDVIVLNTSQSFPAFWLNDLLHEVGHCSQEPESTERSIVESQPTWEDADQSEDEIDARVYAADVIFRSRTDDLVTYCETEAGAVEALKNAVLLVAKSENVPADSLALVMASRVKGSNWWGTAMNLQDKEQDGFATAKSYFDRYISLGTLARDDRELLLQATDGD